MDLTDLSDGLEATSAFFGSFNEGTPLLVSDYDGTLAPFRKDRGEAAPPPAVRRLLLEILQAEGEIIVLSGRRAEEIASLLDIPVEIQGCHGWERRSKEGAVEAAFVPEDFLAAVDALEALLSAFPAAAVERKPVSVALHWRGRRDVESAFRSVSAGIFNEATERELEILPFSEGVEFRIPLFTKGRAMERILGGRAPEDPVCYIGDDATDEDAFAALTGRGLGVLVCDVPRSTAAAARTTLSGVERFLTLWRDALLKKRSEEGESRR